MDNKLQIVTENFHSIFKKRKFTIPVKKLNKKFCIGQEVYVCTICKEVCDQLESFMEHLQEHGKTSRKELLDADNISKEDIYISVNQKKSKVLVQKNDNNLCIGQEVFVCSQCQEVFIDLKSFEQHQEEHILNRNITIHIAVEDFMKMFKRRRCTVPVQSINKNLSIGQEVLVCPECNKVFILKKSLEKHLEEHDETLEETLEPPLKKQKNCSEFIKFQNFYINLSGNFFKYPTTK